MDYQKTFIDIIARYVPEDEKLVDFISRLINLGKEASYRRIRGEVEFTLSEVVTISKALNINLTSLIIREGGEKVTFNLRLPEDANPANSNIKKIESDLNVLEGIDKKSDSTLYSVCRSIPDIFYYEHPYLTKLKLLKTQFNIGAVQPLPLSHIEIPNKLLKIQEEYWNELKYFNLTYILAPNLLTSIISDIQFFNNLNLISEQEKQHLKKELISILNIIDETARTGLFRQKEISLYVSHVILDLSHSLIVSKALDASVIDLHYPNSLLSFDREMCQSHLRRIQVIRKCSSSITMSGEPTKISFLSDQKDMIGLL